MTEIVTKYYETAARYLKVAENFDIQFFGNSIPKNAIYGRISKFVWIYVDDFRQFKTEQTRFDILLLDKRSQSGRFKQEQISKHSDIFYHILAMIEYHGLTKCEYHLRLTNKPKMHTVGQPIYNASPRQLITGDAAEYGAGITETDAIRTSWEKEDLNKKPSKPKSYKDFYRQDKSKKVKRIK